MSWNPMDFKVSLLRQEAALLKIFLKNDFSGSYFVGNTAMRGMRTVIDGTLSGFWHPLSSLIPRLLENVDLAIASREVSGASLEHHQKKLHQARALGHWLLDGSAETQDWSRAVELYRIAMDKGIYSAKELKTDCLDDYLGFCVLAREFETGISEFEKYAGKKEVSLRKALSPRDFGYALCLYAFTGAFSQDEIFEAGKRMIKANIKEWFRLGEYILAATWMKIVYGLRYPDEEAFETLLRAYELMPEIPYPGDYLVNALE